MLHLLCSGHLWVALVVFVGACSSSDGGESDTSALEQEVAGDVGDADTAAAGSCEGVEDETPCDDGNACTQGDRCLTGACVGRENLQCEDAGECQVGTCDPAVGCVTVALDAGQACGSKCASGTCQAGACVIDAGTEVVCEAPSNPCVMAVLCEPTTGLCTREVPVPAGGACNVDGNECTFEACDGAGACVATGEVETCEDEVVADPCWTQVCEPSKGCRRGALLVGLSCNDNNPCTVQDQCVETVSGAGACVGEALVVDDGNACTDDFCEAGEVKHTVINGLSCEPDAECDVAGECVAGECKPVRQCVCPGDLGCATPVCDPPCANGSCVGPDMCECGSSGYSGPTCSTPVCDPPCANGSCVGPDMCECGSSGYSGPTCSTPVCDPPCANGSCVGPDMCECGSSGYSGPTCSTPVCDPACDQGACTDPNICTCDEGYDGPTCSDPVCDPPCEHGGNCLAPNLCDCQGTGYEDDTCSTPVCDPACDQGVCTDPNICTCDEGYDGPTCSDPVCDPPCEHGGHCLAPNLCDCEGTGYEDATCSTPVCDPACDQGACTDPNICTCDEGYDGPICSDPVCDPPCEHGGDCLAPNLCDCDGTGYEDATCSTPVCDPACDQGVCTDPNICTCDEGYDGPICSDPVCNPPCENGGTCISPNLCDCAGTGHEDATCHTPVCTPACDQGACIAPDTCECDPGYTDPRCATPVCNPPCINGTCTDPDVCECDPGFGGPTCETPDTVTWTRTFGTAAEEYAGMSNMLVPSHDGHFLAVGTTLSTDADGDAYLIKVDPLGNLLATRTYGGTVSDSFTGITRLGTGYAACGGSRSYGGSRNKAYCVTLNPDLSAATTNTYGGNDLTNAFDITAIPDHFISAGNTTDTDAWLDIVIRKHNSSGAEVWKKYFGRSQDDTALNVLAMSDGGFLLSGFSGGWSGCQQYYVIKVDSAGNKVFDRTYGGCVSSTAQWHQGRQAIEVEGGFAMTGSVLVNGQRSAFIQRFAANGDPVWLSTFGGNDIEYGSGLIQTADGGFAMLGWTRSFGAGADDIYLVKTDADGVKQWDRTYGGAADDQGYAIRQMPDGGYLLAGSTRSWGAGGADIVIIRTDPLGNAPGYAQCTPACANGGVCVGTNQCDCDGTGFFGDTCQYDEDEYTNTWDRDTEPQVVAMNPQVTLGTLSWKRLTAAALYRVSRYSGANYGRVHVVDTTERTFDGQVGQAYRVEALDAAGVLLDFVNVGISNLVAPIWTTGTFIDNFEDGAIASNYLNLKPHQAVENNGYLQLTQTITDDYSAFYLPYDTEGRRYLKVTARLYQFRNNSQYTGGISYSSGENSWKYMYFASPWEDYRSYRGGQMRAGRYRSNLPAEAFEQIWALDSVSRFGAWFEYELVLDTVTGTASGKLGTDTFPGVFPVSTQFRPAGRVFIYFSPYAWFTGHYLRIDDLRVEAYD